MRAAAAGPGGVFRPLLTFDRDDYAAHLRRLSPEDRRSRFHAEASDDRIAAHAATALRGPGRVFGWFHDGVLRGAAEVALSRGGLSAEAAFEVEAPFRNRGVGSALLAATLLWARNRGARRLLVQTTRGNVPMMRAAIRQGATFAFDLSDAEGAIEAHAPTLRSHMDELLAVESAWMRWAAEQARLRWTRFMGAFAGLRGA
jgi:GNAT superfamily N-acetyltransferase